MSKINTYIKLLKDYNSHTNIYSKNSYDHLPFHIENCIKLADIITNTNLNILDIGSGSGLPAIIIAITNPNNMITAVESKSRKTKFLTQVKNQLHLSNLTIITDDINHYIKQQKPTPDIITAKAFAPLEKCLKITNTILNKNTAFYIPVSQNQLKTITPQANKTITTIENDPHYFLKITHQSPS